MGCFMTPLGELDAPLPMTSSALASNGAIASPAASDVPLPCGVNAFEATFDQSAFDESVHGPAS